MINIRKFLWHPRPLPLPQGGGECFFNVWLFFCAKLSRREGSNYLPRASALWPHAS
jgi:hypothetical protein